MSPLKTTVEDQLLIIRCAKQEPGAIEDLTALYGESLYGFLRSALGQRSAFAHDSLTGAFVQTLRAAPSLKEPLRVTLMRFLLSGLQKNLKQKHSEGPLPGLDSKLSVLFTALGRLSWEERVYLLLRDQMDYSLEELEAVFLKTESEIRGQLQKIRLRFREELRRILKENKGRP